MFNGYHAIALIVFLITQPCHADGESLDIIGVRDSVLQFRNWNESLRAWSDINYKGQNLPFKIYSLPSNRGPSGIETVASSDVDMVSPAKKFVMVQRIVSGKVTDEQGNNVISEQTYCDAVSLENGCVVNVGSALQCDGAWVGEKWKAATEGVLDFSKAGFPPKQLISEVSGLSSSESRSNSLMDLVFMGVPSYMACYPPEKNISEYNDIGFYFAQGGEHLLAMQIYNKLLSLAPDRVPLKLNVADSLWALGKQAEAKSFYVAYRDAMLKRGAASKVPVRVEERSH